MDLLLLLFRSAFNLLPFIAEEEGCREEEEEDGCREGEEDEEEEQEEEEVVCREEEVVCREEEVLSRSMVEGSAEERKSQQIITLHSNYN